MDKLIREMTENGKDINEVLNMPYHFVINLLKDKNKPKQESSLIAAFGG